MTADTLPGSAELLRSGAELLRQAGIDSPRREARLLLAQISGLSPGELVGTSSALPPEIERLYFAAVRRRARREPLAYITGKREFWSLPFRVGPGVLIPRPETETLIECALRHFNDPDAQLNVLDLGVGSGCLLLAFLSERPQARGIGIDMCQTSLLVAQENARDLNLSGRAAFRLGNWTDGLDGQFDVVFSNPPYIATAELPGLGAELSYEPRAALDGGLDGVEAYREIAAGLPKLLARGGLAFIELGYGQASAVEELIISANLKVSGAVCDLAGVPRCMIVRVS